MIQRALIVATMTSLCVSACQQPPETAADLAPVDMSVDMNTDLATTTIRYTDIQSDFKSLACTIAGCHNPAATNKLNIDTTAGKERSNYDAMIAAQMIIPGSPSTSPLIVVPATGQAAGGQLHVKTLTSTKLANWTA